MSDDAMQYLTPEARAQLQIDKMLRAVGWEVRPWVRPARPRSFDQRRDYLLATRRTCRRLWPQREERHLVRGHQ